MSSKSTRTPKHSMSRRLTRLVAGATLGISALTIAAPAMAINKPEPSGGCVDRTLITPIMPASPPRGSHVPVECPTLDGPPLPPEPTTQLPATADVSDSVDLSSAGLGALAGIALGGAGLGVMLAIQRRRDRSA
ncbi:hypothetical protein [Kribbella sp. NPDC000426]|uniref:hypothetical protein n=1 Tax=Kribbella sp. NPDC000426 TaxID=3154255 RepID=UPI00333282B9